MNFVEAIPAAVELGVVGVALIVVYRMTEVLKIMFLKTRAPGAVQATQFAMACQTDPRHFQRIREVHEMMLSQDEGIKRGEFKCQWKDRDEIRDLLEAIRALTLQLRVANNGNGAGAIKRGQP